MKYTIYELAEIIIHPYVFFSKRKRYKRQVDALFNGQLNTKVFDPNITNAGLKLRNLYITSPMIALTFIFTAICIIALLAKALFAPEVYDFIFTLNCSYLLITGLWGSLYRANISYIDIFRFKNWVKKGNTPETFKISKNAYYRWYDFCIALPFAIYFMLMFFGVIPGWS